MPDRVFVPGAVLSAELYRQVVRPLLGGQPHAAALLGEGSDVLGFDTARSTDHGWGPRLQLFLDRPDAVDAVRRRLDTALPDELRGWPVRFGWDDEPVAHHVTVTTLPAWCRDHLGVDATSGLSDLDWLLTPQQLLLGVTSGAVHADDSGDLTRLRRALAWYPDQVWRWLLACQWHRLAQEEAFVSRTAEVGDDLGSAVVAARLVRDVMRLALLLDRHYAPYTKWLGTAFAQVRHDDALPDHLGAALAAAHVAGREAALARAYEAVARRHGAARLTPPLDPTPRSYHGRPARVLMADRFTEALLRTVDSPALLALPLVGAVDSAVDSTDVLSSPGRCRRLSVLYDRAGDGDADVPLHARR